MALYHFTAKAVSRGKGQSAVHTAAYNAREQLHDDRENRDTKDYGYKGVTEFSGIFCPKDAPAWAHDREQLWNHVEAAEKRKDSQLARNVEFALPHELNAEQRRRLVTDFVRETFARRGMIADVNIHEPHQKNDDRNYHVHCLLTMRRLDGDEFAAKKETDWNKKAELADWREKWAHMGAKALERAGFEQEANRFRHGHKLMADQMKAAVAFGDREWAEHCDREAQIHKGPAVSAMEQRNDPRLADNDRARESKEIDERNALRAEIRADEKELAALRAEKQRQMEAEKNPELEPQFGRMRGVGWHNRDATKTEEKIFLMLDGAERGGEGVGAALYKAGLTLARVDAAGKIQFEQEHMPLMEAAKSERPVPWMNETGGVEALSEEHYQSAQASYERWKEAKPDLAKKYGFESYVDYVQEQWAKNEQGKQEQDKQEPQHRAAPFREGELVAVNRWGYVHQLNPRFLPDLEKLEQLATGGMAKTPSLSSALDHFAIGTQPSRHVAMPAGELNQTHADIRLGVSLGKNGEAFAEYMEDKGHILARVTAEEAYDSERLHAFAKEVGNYAPKYREGEILVVNDRGAVYRLDGRTTGLHDRDAIDKFTATIADPNFFSLTEAKELQREASRAHFIHEKISNQPETAIEKEIARLDWLADAGDSPLRTVLDNEGISLARVDAAGKLDVQRQYDTEFYDAWANGIGNAKQRQASFVEGELVAVTRNGAVHRLNSKHIDHDQLEQKVCGQYGAASLSSVREFYAADRAAEQAQRQQDTRDFSQDVKGRREDRAAAWDTIKEARSSNRARDQFVNAAVNSPRDAVEIGVGAGLKVITGAGVQALDKFVMSLFSGTGDRPKPTSDEVRQHRALVALGHIADSIEAGENLKEADIRNLLPGHIENLKRDGDSAMRLMISELEQYRKDELERQHERGRGH